MNSLINSSRPRVFCPGCLHAPVIRALDQALSRLDLKADRIALVSEIGCSGHLDTFFNTHALHGLHGRALTYAAGLKLSRPELSVVAAMGDGGIGIGGAHLIAACRRNIDITPLRPALRMWRAARDMRKIWRIIFSEPSRSKDFQFWISGESAQDAAGGKTASIPSEFERPLKRRIFPAGLCGKIFGPNTDPVIESWPQPKNRPTFP